MRLFVSIFVPDRNVESHSFIHTSLAFHCLLRSPELHPRVLPFGVQPQAAMDWGCDHCAPPETAPIHRVTAARESESGVGHQYIVPPASHPKFLYAGSPFRRTPESQKRTKESLRHKHGT